MEGLVKDQYFIFRDTKTERIYLEHIHAGKYDMIKDWINKERIVYQTNNIKDPKLIETGEEKIIWDRHAVTTLNQLRKIIVPFNPNDYEGMENLFNQKVLEVEAKALLKRKEIEEYRKAHPKKKKKRVWTEEEWRSNIQDVIAKKEITNSFISEDADEMTAMGQWKNSGFITPPPDRIMEIKRTYRNMSWKNFKEFVNSVV
nr:hypothetical protein [uncultured Treponema sp.]